MKSNFLDGKKELITKLLFIIESEKEALEKRIQTEFIDRMYENIYILHPWELQKVISQELGDFFRFLKIKDLDICKESGKQAAINGLTINLILSFFFTLQDIFTHHTILKNSTNSLLISEIIRGYLKNYIPAFFIMHNEQIHDQQKQLYESKNTTINKQRKQLEIKERQLQESKMKALKARVNALIKDHETMAQRELARFKKRILSTIRSPEKKRVQLTKIMDIYDLSPRQRDVLPHVLAGLLNTEIAKILYIDLETVNKHIQNIKNKCGVKRKIQLLNIFKV